MDTPQAKAPALGGETGPLGNQQRRDRSTGVRRPLKWQRVLAAFERGGHYNRFDAARELHDSCLNSTVATLQGMGVVIARRMESVPGFQGCPTEVMRYWLAPESHQKALELLGRASPSPAAAHAPTEQSDTFTGAR